MGLGQVVGAHLKMPAGGIHAPQHDLIIQHQLPDQFGSGNLERTVAAWDARQHVQPVQSKRVEKIELQLRDPGSVQDKVHAADLLLDLIRRHLTAIEIAPADSVQPFRAGCVCIHHVEPINFAASQPQYHGSQQADRP